MLRGINKHESKIIEKSLAFYLNLRKVYRRKIITKNILI
jgi:hypothetical protein